MKKLFCLFAAGLLCLTDPAPAGAEKLDMGQLTCQDFKDMDAEAITSLYFWLDGYFSAKSGDTVLDTDGVENDVHAMLDACDNAPDRRLLDIFK